MDHIETQRLILRRWQAEDFAPFAQINRDPQVMEYMPKLLTEQESYAFIHKIEGHFKKHGFGLFATVLRATKELIGFVGLNIPEFEAPFTPCVEIGWRLASLHWGRGYATEAAMAVLRYGFEVYGLDEIVSFTVPSNLRSRRVMEKLGMTRDPQDDFRHPKLDEAHPLSHHVLYKIDKRAYLNARLPIC